MSLTLAADHSPPPKLHEALESLRHALASRTSEFSTSETSACVGPALRVVCRRAREANLPAERLLVQLKRTLDAVPANTELEAHRRAEQKTTVIELAIREYFASAG
jgi:hypothetical protein